MHKIKSHRKSNRFELLQYDNFFITQKCKTKYLRFYESYNSTHLNYCKENDETIKKEFPCIKYKRLLFLNNSIYFFHYLYIIK